jgi:hypothetical protein
VRYTLALKRLILADRSNVLHGFIARESSVAALACLGQDRLLRVSRLPVTDVFHERIVLVYFVLKVLRCLDLGVYLID